MKIFFGDIIKMNVNDRKPVDEDDYDVLAFDVVVHDKGKDKACPICFTREEIESISTFDLLYIMHQKSNHAFIELDKLK